MGGNMKKLSIILSLIMLVLTGCGASTTTTAIPTTESITATEASTTEILTEETTEEVINHTPIRIATLKGPTGMGLSKLIHDDNVYDISVIAAVDEIVPMIIQNKADIAAVPANLASVLYQKTQGQIQVLGINTLGVLYLVQNNPNITDLEQLKGKTIYASGKGATPEYILKYVLQTNGIDPEKDVTIEWKSQHAEVVSALSATDGAIGLLPQPFVTVAAATTPSIETIIDMNASWNQIQQKQTNPSKLVTGVVIVQKDFAKEHPDAVEAFLKDYKSSVSFVNEEIEVAAQYIEEAGIIKAPIAKKAIPFCNIVMIDGKEMKADLEGYYQILFDQNPKSVGGTLPDEAFYFIQN